MSQPIKPSPTTPLRACPTLSLIRWPVYEAITKVIPVANAAVATDPMPIVPIARATIPLRVNPVNKLKPVSSGRALVLLALLAALDAIKNKTNSAINATKDNG